MSLDHELIDITVYTIWIFSINAIIADLSYTSVPYILYILHVHRILLLYNLSL